MTVTEIVELSKKRSRVCVDHELCFVLYKGELSQYGIAEGKELAEELYRKLFDELLPRRAKLRAMNLLQSRDYTESQLRDKLRDGGYPETVTAQALEYVKSFRYVDDLRYAGDYLTTFAGRKSLRRMEQDLQQKGIARTVIEQAVELWQEQCGGQDELQMACELLDKRHYDREASDRRQQQRMYNFLMYRGFSSDVIRKALQAE
ncbi:MAG: recombination regulator RecX [bacterium]|nr:recombination regulator RecX [bacterium]MCM1374937.1 recombination regulator RecX [Muribaculum sp.]